MAVQTMVKGAPSPHRGVDPAVADCTICAPTASGEQGPGDQLLYQTMSSLIVSSIGKTTRSWPSSVSQQPLRTSSAGSHRHWGERAHSLFTCGRLRRPRCRGRPFLVDRSPRWSAVRHGWRPRLWAKMFDRDVAHGRRSWSASGMKVPPRRGFRSSPGGRIECSMTATCLPSRPAQSCRSPRIVNDIPLDVAGVALARFHLGGHRRVVLEQDA